MLLNKDTGLYSLAINFQRTGIAIGFIGKTTRAAGVARGFVACYGGGGKLFFGNACYLRVWRIMVAVKLPFIKPQLFEIYWPKKYILL